MTPVPILPLSIFRPPVAWKGCSILATILASPGSAGTGRRTTVPFVAELHLDRIGRQALAGDGADIVMQQAGLEQFAHDEAETACGLEMVHVGKPVGIDAGQQRDLVGKIGDILPGQVNAGGARHGDQMQRVVGRAAGGMKPDDRVDEGPLVDHLACRGVIVAERGDGQRPLGRLAGQRVAKRRAGIDEGGAGHVQPHEFHQHLVGIGGAVEGAGAGP